MGDVRGRNEASHGQGEETGLILGVNVARPETSNEGRMGIVRQKKKKIYHLQRKFSSEPNYSLKLAHQDFSFALKRKILELITDPFLRYSFSCYSKKSQTG